MKIKNVRSQVPRDPRNRAPQKRNLNDIRRIVWHHGMTRRGLGGTNYLAYLRFHVNDNGWRLGGYTFGVEPNGEILQGYDLDIITYHVGNYNRHSLGIVLPGDFRYEDPTSAQYKAAVELTNWLLDQLPRNDIEVVGHQEVPTYAWKNCPAIDMNKVRRDVRNKKSSGGIVKGTSTSVTLPQLISPFMRGNDVKDIQADLTKLGYDLGEVDGIFGPKTDAAVRAFQKNAKITVDGIVGPQTLGALKDALEKKQEKAEEEKSKAPAPADEERWRLVTGTFSDADTYARAIRRIENRHPWLIHEFSTKEGTNPYYRIVTGTFRGKNVAEFWAEDIRENLGWNVRVQHANDSI
ncbi:N-acetylmuramoyl-L-alanine amidase [Thalassobacillus sp. C254]|uniref:peptidoglycan recognition protein family protein n=1 Tax=Thalassobacillus sp. C254 TaxID=1225341 RepID=UPI0006D1E1B7|nr:N-acetylmuramoyl-L-alanine amidase [Thalassobacillus sp. C254]